MTPRFPRMARSREVKFGVQYILNLYDRYDSARALWLPARLTRRGEEVEPPTRAISDFLGC